MRTYEPIWIAIKKYGFAKVLCSPPMRRRLIEGVRKEKKKDLGWKLMQAEDNKRHKLKETIYEDSIKFYLDTKTVINIHTL